MMRYALALMLLPIGGCFSIDFPTPEEIHSMPLPDIDLRVQESGVDASLRGVFAVDANVCWASGSDGTCLRTVNGGDTWERIQVPNASEIDFRDVHPFDAQNAVLMTAGTPARIYRTSDAGVSWTIAYEDHREGAFFDSMDFWDDQRGVLFGDPIDGVFTILLTDDGGWSWRHVDRASIPPAMDGEAGFAASGTCVATGGDGEAIIGLGGDTGLPTARVLETDDFGETWAARASNMPTSASSGIFSVAFVDDDEIVAVGGDYANPAFSNERDLNSALTGASFQPAYTKPCDEYWFRKEIRALMSYRSSVAVGELDGHAVLLAGGHEYCVVSSHLASYHWKWIVTIPGSNTEKPWHQHAVSFAPGTSRAWVVGAEGQITRLDLAVPMDLDEN